MAGIPGRKMYIKRFIAFTAACSLILAWAFARVEVKLLPQRGDKVSSEGAASMDITYRTQGYIMAKHNASKKLVVMQVKSGGQTSTYVMNNSSGDYDVYPLPYGSGDYVIEIRINTTKDSYSLVMSKYLTIKMDDENSAFLYPNRFVNYDADTWAVAKSYELCADLKTDKEKCNAIANYVKRVTMYDYVKALSAPADKNYVPDLTACYRDNPEQFKGICYDISSLLACMLRVQGIPCKLVEGKGDGKPHAWNSIYLDGKWVDYDPTAVTTGQPMTEYTASTYK